MRAQPGSRISRQQEIVGAEDCQRVVKVMSALRQCALQQLGRWNMVRHIHVVLVEKCTDGGEPGEVHVEAACQDVPTLGSNIAMYCDEERVVTLRARAGVVDSLHDTRSQSSPSAQHDW